MKATKLAVNGKVYTVERASENTVELLGPRGGAAVLVKNVHTGRWVLIVDTNSRKPRTFAVDQMAEVA